MGRLAPEHKLETGEVSTRVIVNARVWEVAEKIGAIYAPRDPRPGTYGVWWLLHQLGAVFKSGPIPTGLGPDIEDIVLSLRSKAEQDKFKIPEHVDVTKLHRSPKLRSGFVGVYSNGRGFRAQYRLVDGTSKQIGRDFNTAEEAAWARREYYIANKLPYGAYEETVEELCKNFPHMLKLHPNEIKRQTLQYIEDCNMTDRIFAPGSASIVPDDLPKEHEEAHNRKLYGMDNWDEVELEKLRGPLKRGAESASPPSPDPEEPRSVAGFGTNLPPSFADDWTPGKSWESPAEKKEREREERLKAKK